MPRKALTFLTLILVTPIIFANSKTNNFFNISKLPSRFSFNLQSIKMPDANEKNTGLFGLEYLVDIKPWWYAGVGGYGSLSGKRGGLFVLGIDTGLQHKLLGNFSANAGIYLGGGGGGIAMVGGGLMVKPYANLFYDFKWFRLGAGYSEIRFTSGHIASHQITGTIELPVNLYFSKPSYADEVVENLRQIAFFKPGIINFAKDYIAALYQTYLQKKGIKNIHGKVNDRPVSLVGVEIGHFITQQIFMYLKASGAIAGTHNGYMDMLIGSGYNYKLPILPRLSVRPSIAVGAGGGGTISTGGGLLIEPRIGLNFQIAPTIGIGVNGGYMFAPCGSFKAISVTANLTYSLLFGTPDNKHAAHSFIPRNLAFRGWRIRIGNQSYFNPQRDNTIKGNLQLVTVKFDVLLNRYIYFTGQAGSAYAGNAGGYASGMLGVGVNTKPLLHKRISFNAEFLSGAAGGGSIAVERGALIEPVVGATLHLNEYLGIFASAGRILALQGKLNSTVFEAGLTFAFSSLTATPSA